MGLIEVRVPGKVMLSGEYAVLCGAEAFVMPVPRQLTAQAVDYVPEKAYSPVVQFALRYPLPEAAAFEKKYGRSHVVIDTSEFFVASESGYPVKLGLGLSAAEAVAVVVLRFERAGRRWAENKDKIFQRAWRIHLEVQQGLGSGADVAACAYGQPLRFRLLRQRPRVQPEQVELCRPAAPLTLIWSGQPANTRESLKIFLKWKNSGGRLVKRLIGQLVEAANLLAGAWFSAPAGELFDRIDLFNEAMQRCSAACGLDYRSPVHVQLERWAKDRGGRAKPTGAGGGDMILLVGDLPFSELGMLALPLCGTHAVSSAHGW